MGRGGAWDAGFGLHARSHAAQAEACTTTGHALALLLMVLVVGCRSPGRDGAPQAFFPERVTPLPQLVASINANNQAIPTLFASGDLEATIYDETGRKRSLVGDVSLLYRKPRELLFRVKKDVVGTVLAIGSTDDRYWLSASQEAGDTMWWGYHANAGKPGTQQVPIRPDLVIEVLGLGIVGTDLLRPPVPAVRFNTDASAYMLTWQSPVEGYWRVEKEIWYDYKTHLPVKVILYDREGRPVLRANLSEHRRLAVEGLPQERWPAVATRFGLFFPQSRSSMSITLGGRGQDLALQKRGLPREGTITFGMGPDVARTVQLDAESPQR